MLVVPHTQSTSPQTHTPQGLDAAGKLPAVQLHSVPPKVLRHASRSSAPRVVPRQATRVVLRHGPCRMAVNTQAVNTPEHALCSLNTPKHAFAITAAAPQAVPQAVHTLVTSATGCPTSHVTAQRVVLCYPTACPTLPHVCAHRVTLRPTLSNQPLSTRTLCLTRWTRAN